MRALRYHGVKDLRVDDNVPEPQCKPHEIKVKPAYIGICGTDLHEYSTPTFVPQPGAPHGITVSQPPRPSRCIQASACSSNIPMVPSHLSIPAPLN